MVWCAGMRASSLTEQLPVPRDRLGRVQVDDYLRVVGVPAVFAAGDVAAARMDDEHLSVMSCQHGRPMGRYAGYNVISDLFDEPMLALRIPWYVTVLDLGPAGAVYTEGWDRAVVSMGARGQGDQADHQHPPHLSTADRQPRRPAGRRRAGAAGPPLMTITPTAASSPAYQCTARTPGCRDSSATNRSSLAGVWPSMSTMRGQGGLVVAGRPGVDTAQRHVVAAGVLHDLRARVLFGLWAANHLHQEGLQAFVFVVGVVRGRSAGRVDARTGGWR